MYEYVDKEPEVGDIVLWDDVGENPYIEYNKPYIIEEVRNSGFVRVKGKNNHLYTLGSNTRRVIKTSPGYAAKPGDTCIRLKYGSKHTPTGSLITVLKTSSANVYWGHDNSNLKTQFLVLHKHSRPVIKFTV